MCTSIEALFGMQNTNYRKSHNRWVTIPVHSLIYLPRKYGSYLLQVVVSANHPYLLLAALGLNCEGRSSKDRRNACERRSMADMFTFN